MTNPEFSENSFDNIDNEFTSLLNGEAQRLFHGYLVRSLAAEKQQILDALVDQLIILDKVKIGSYDNFERIIDTMTVALEERFKTIDGINYEDDIVASGATIALAVDRNDPECNVGMLTIDHDECIRGEIDRLVLVEIPAFEKIKNVIEDHAPLEDEADNNDFGIALRIKHAIIENDELETDAIPENIIVMIPLNYPTLVLDAVIKTENLR